MTDKLKPDIDKVEIKKINGMETIRERIKEVDKIFE